MLKCLAQAATKRLRQFGISVPDHDALNSNSPDGKQGQNSDSEEVMLPVIPITATVDTGAGENTCNARINVTTLLLEYTTSTFPVA